MTRREHSMQKHLNAAETIARTRTLHAGRQRPCRPASGGYRSCDTERSHGDSAAGWDMAEAATVFRSILLVILLRSIERSC